MSSSAMQMKQVLFVIRGKLGDTLATYASVRAFRDAHPDWETALLVRKAYSVLFEGEDGVRVIPFDSRMEMIVRLLWERATKPNYDVLATPWGFGGPIRSVARLVDAPRKIHFRGGHSDLYNESARLPPAPDLFDAGWETARIVDRDFPKPQALRVPALERRYRAYPRDEEIIGVAPVADELRKNFDPTSLRDLVAEVRLRYPRARIRVLANPRDEGAAALSGISWPEGVTWRPFRNLRTLVGEYLGMTAWYGTDTGLYHVAVAMGLPATVFFGPTQPWRVVAAKQPNATVVRLAGFGRAHCDVLDCRAPVCLHRAVSLWSHSSALAEIEGTPDACPLRGMATDGLERLG